MTRISKFYEYLKENLNLEPFYHGSPYAFDKFDMSKVGTGDGKSKYGYGLYFSDSISAASYYAKELSVGKLKHTGFNLYEVRLKHAGKYLGWNEQVPDWVYSEIYDKLVKNGFTDEADTIEQDTSEENGYEMWSVRSFYEYLEAVLGSKPATSKFLYECEVFGIKEEDVFNGGTIFVAYSDEDVQIVNVEKLNAPLS